MKKTLFAMVLLIAVVFSGCKKDDPVVVPDRDKFIGSWTGTQTVIIKFDGEVVSNETTAVTKKIDAGTDVDEIILDKNTEDEFNAKVTGSSFNIPEQSNYGRIEGVLVEASIAGNGVLSQNNVLTVSYTMITDYENVSINVIFTETLNKN